MKMNPDKSQEDEYKRFNEKLYKKYPELNENVLKREMEIN